jgi:Concanavalin A-like lectin/glucanases superfamily
MKTGAILCALLAVAVGCSSRPQSRSVVPQSGQRHVMTALATSYDAAVLSYSPYAYYRLDETSGTTAYDASGNGRNGTYKGTSGTHYLLGQSSIVPGLTNSPEFYAANPGAPKVALPSMSLAFNGSSWASDFTVTFWAKPDPTAVSQSADMVEMNDYYVGQWNPSTTGAGTTPYQGDYTLGNWSSTTASVSDGAAHFFAQVVHRNADGSGCQMSLYVDGTLAQSNFETSHCGGNSLAYATNAGIGGRVSYSAGSAAYFGEIGGVAFFSRALGAADVSNLYGGISQPTPSPTPSPTATPTATPTPTGSYDQVVLQLSPYAYYRLDETSGTTAHDSSGNGNDGTYEGTSGTHYLLGQSSIVPGLANTAKFYAANPGAPKVALPSIGVAYNGSAWVSDFSVSFWAKPDPSAISQASDMVEINDYYVGQWNPSTNGAGTTPYQGDYTLGNWSSTTASVSDGNAHLFVQTVHRNTDGSGCQIILYMDGWTVVQSTLESNHCGGNSLAYTTNAGIGGRVSYAAGAGGYFGEIGGVAIFKRALAASEVNELWTGTIVHR